MWNWLYDLRDLSVSRQRERLPWGIPVPGDDSQTVSGLWRRAGGGRVGVGRVVEGCGGGGGVCVQVFLDLFMLRAWIQVHVSFLQLQTRVCNNNNREFIERFFRDSESKCFTL